jgi:hypothetical protein
MTRKDLLQRVRQKPFVPFRMVLTEGTAYEVRHPDFVMVGRDSLVVGLPGEQEQEFYETSVLIDLIHIVRLEPLEAGTPSASSK